MLFAGTYLAVQYRSHSIAGWLELHEDGDDHGGEADSKTTFITPRDKLQATLLREPFNFTFNHLVFPVSSIWLVMFNLLSKSALFQHKVQPGLSYHSKEIPPSRVSQLLYIL